jgi:hypothetical protein
VIDLTAISPSNCSAMQAEMESENSSIRAFTFSSLGYTAELTGSGFVLTETDVSDK